MPKFLKAVQAQDPPEAPTGSGAHCKAGDWVTAGNFALCDLAQGYLCDPPCGCDATFLAPDCHARCAIAEVAEIDAASLDTVKHLLIESLTRTQQAPDGNAARRVAEKEIGYTSCLAASFPAETRIRVKRTASSDGAIEEKYDQCEPVPEIRIEP